MATKLRLSKERLFDYLGYKPHPGQALIHASRAPRRVVAAGVRLGKTVCAAMEVVACAMEPRAQTKIWCVAPTYDLAGRVFDNVVMTVTERLRQRILKLSRHEQLLELRNMGGGTSIVRAKSADNPDSLLGEGLDFVVVDEAARLKPAIWQNYLCQRLLDRQGKALLISTPRGKGYFFDLWQRGQHGRDPDYESWNMPSSASPLLDAEMIERERARLPERVFRQEFLAEFIEGSGAVFHGIRELATGEFQEPLKGEPYFAGVDLAKVEDFTVVVIMDKKFRVVAGDRFHRLDWDVQTNRVRALCDRYNRASMLVDATGVGDPVLEGLIRAGCRAEAYPFTAKSKAALVSNLSILSEKKKLVLPRADVWPDLVDELEAYEFSVGETGNVRTSAPSGLHDDCVMATALAAWQVGNRSSGFSFRSANNFGELRLIARGLR